MKSFLSRITIRVLLILGLTCFISAQTINGLVYESHQYITQGSRSATLEMSTGTIIEQQVPFHIGDLGLSFIFSTSGHKITGNVHIFGKGDSSGFVYFDRIIPGNKFQNNQFVDFLFPIIHPFRNETLTISFTADNEQGFGLSLLTTDENSLQEHILTINGKEMPNELVIQKIRLYPTACFYLLNIIVILFTGIVSIHNLVKQQSNEMASNCYRKKKHSYYLVLFALFISFLFLTFTRKTYFLWDNHNLHESFISYSTKNNINLDDLIFFDHISFGYNYIAFLLTKIFHSAAFSQIIYGKILLLLGIYGFWKFMHLVYTETNDYLIGLLALCYMLSPYLSGMSTYCYHDPALWYIIPLLTYLIYTEHVFSAVICALFFLFTKETAVISYASLIAALYIFEYHENKRLFHDILRFICLVLPIILWLFAYFFIVHWDGVGTFSLNISYIIRKTKTYFCVNFNWLFFLFCFIAIFSILFKTNYKKYQIFLLPTAVSIAAYYVFSICFITVDHVRYIDALISQLYMIAAFVPFVLLKGKKSIALSLTEGFLLGISCIKTIDPIMIAVFPHVNIGGDTMITTNQILSDGMVYNRQYQYFGYAIDMALNEVCTDKDNVLFFPAGQYHNSWYFDANGTFENIPDSSEIIINSIWDPEIKTRIYSNNNQLAIPFQIHVIDNNYQIQLDELQTGYYFFMDCYGAEKAEMIKSEKNILDETEYNSHGWIIKRIHFRDK